MALKVVSITIRFKFESSLIILVKSTCLMIFFSPFATRYFCFHTVLALLLDFISCFNLFTSLSSSNISLSLLSMILALSVDCSLSLGFLRFSNFGGGINNLHIVIMLFANSSLYS